MLFLPEKAQCLQMGFKVLPKPKPFCDPVKWFSPFHLDHPDEKFFWILQMKNSHVQLQVGKIIFSCCYNNLQIIFSCCFCTQRFSFPFRKVSAVRIFLCQSPLKWIPLGLEGICLGKTVAVTGKTQQSKQRIRKWRQFIIEMIFLSCTPSPERDSGEKQNHDIKKKKSFYSAYLGCFETFFFLGRMLIGKNIVLCKFLLCLWPVIPAETPGINPTWASLVAGPGC